MTTDETTRRAEGLFVEHLRRMGLKRTEQRITVFHTFQKQDQAISAQDLLYAVKRTDVMISFNVLYQVLRVMKACGIAREIRNEDTKRTAILYAPVSLTPAVCSHQHLVCKDCGAVIKQELESQPEARSARLMLVKA